MGGWRGEVGDWEIKWVPGGGPRENPRSLSGLEVGGNKIWPYIAVKLHSVLCRYNDINLVTVSDRKFQAKMTVK